MDGDTAGDMEAAAEGSLWICVVVPHGNPHSSS